MIGYFDRNYGVNTITVSFGSSEKCILYIRLFFSPVGTMFSVG
jgi:hypothetical protein